MQFVEHHAAQSAEQIRRVGRGQQQRQLLRRGEQNVGRIAALALPFGRGRVAGARFQPDGRGPFRAPGFPGCGRCRPPTPSAARCKGCAGPASGEAHGRSKRGGAPGLPLRKTPPASAETRRASCRRRSARSAAPSAPPAPWPAIRADAAAAPSRGRRTSARTGPAAAARPRFGRWRLRVPLAEPKAYLNATRGHARFKS